VCLKCTEMGHRIAECIVGGFKSEKALNLNAMLDHMQDNVDSEMDPDSYLCSIHDHSNFLKMYHCEVNKVQGTALADTGAKKLCLSEVR
jgi:hypothetical protein